MIFLFDFVGVWYFFVFHFIQQHLNWFIAFFLSKYYFEYVTCSFADLVESWTL